MIESVTESLGITEVDSEKYVCVLSQNLVRTDICFSHISACSLLFTLRITCRFSIAIVV